MTPMSLRTGTTRHTIAIIDGPNMTNLGARNPRVYGSISSLQDLQDYCRAIGSDLGIEVLSFASNTEGTILEYIHEHASKVDGFIINPAGLTEIGIPTKHALSETGKPFIEVHFANVVAPPHHPRGLPIGPWDSVFTPAATGAALGMRQYSYAAALVGLTLALDDETFLGASE